MTPPADRWPSAPTPTLPVQVLDHRRSEVAAAIHQVLVVAYAQEAQLLGAQHFPALQRTPLQIQASADFHLGVWRDSELLGVLSIGPDDEPDQLCIGLLVVHPRAQRQGIGRQLLRAALQRGPGMVFAVATGARNAPALALYQEQGFAVYRHGAVGAENLPLVKLRRPPG